MARIQEVPGQVGFGRAFKDFWAGYVDFKGRSTRAGYWWMVLLGAILSFITVMLLVGSITALITRAATAATTPDAQLAWMVSQIGAGPLIVLTLFVLLFSLVLVLPTMTLTVRRFRDAGINGWPAGVYLLITYLFTNTMTGDADFSQPLQVLWLVLNIVLNVGFFVITVLPTDALATDATEGWRKVLFRQRNWQEPELL